MQISGANQLIEQVRDRGLCVGCGACVGLCPYFKAYKGKVAITFSCDRDQGRCFAHCPRTDVDYNALSKLIFNKPYESHDLGTCISIKAAKAGTGFKYAGFQNGGTVSALMACAMEEKLIDCAVVTESEHLIPTPRIATDVRGILGASSTKYMAAPTVSKVNEAMTRGFEKIGVVGTPCQMTAIAQIKTNPLHREDFKDTTALLIGLFCTWAVDTRTFIGLVSQQTDITHVTGMEIPPPPAEVFILRTQDKDIEIPLEKIRQIIPKGCAMCPDMTCEWSDVSVGAFEGKPGWNTLIIRTPKGENLVNTAVSKGFLEIENFPGQNLAHLTAGAANKKSRGLENQKQETIAFKKAQADKPDPAPAVVELR